MSTLIKRLVVAASIILALLLALYASGLLHYVGLDAYTQRTTAELEASNPGHGGATSKAGMSGNAGTSTGKASTSSGAGSAPQGSAVQALFTPPGEDKLPAGAFGDVIRRGQEIFTDTPRAVPQYVGNTMRCSSCHLDAGRLANASPLWAGYVSYPAYRSKTKEVTTFQQRLQGCFEYSMNGKAPPLGAPELVALESYSYWLATGAKIDTKLPGRGYPKVPRPDAAPDYVRGEKVYQENCALCHAADGSGQRTPEGHTVFPALWGADSFNWGAGMGQIHNAAGFIKANMPLGLPGTLSDQQAWDVALFMDSHERPQDPRYKGSVAATQKDFHSPGDMYGQTVNGKVLGETGAPKPFKPLSRPQQ